MGGSSLLGGKKITFALQDDVASQSMKTGLTKMNSIKVSSVA